MESFANAMIAFGRKRRLNCSFYFIVFRQKIVLSTTKITLARSYDGKLILHKVLLPM